MIVPMKKTMILALEHDRANTLSQLGKLGLLHVEISQMKDSEDRSDLQHRLDNVANIINEIISVKSGKNHLPPPDTREMDGSALFEYASDAYGKMTELRKKLDYLLRNISMLEPWGNFDFPIVEELRKNGLNIYFCSATHEIFGYLNGKYTCKIVKSDKHKVLFVVISSEEIEPALIPVVAVPSEISLGDARRELQENKDWIAVQENLLAALKKHLDLLKEYEKELIAEKEYLGIRDSMGSMDKIVSVTGYMPSGNIEALKKSALENGWGLLINDPLPEDMVPTLIKLPAIFRIVRPIFDFIGVEPGYDELDVSVCFLFFFTIFFAMLVGDAGYGTLFLMAGIFCKFKFKDVKPLKLPINLFIFLSLATISWGILNGAYFGISTAKFPSWMKGLNFFTDINMRDKNIQLVCFLLAGCHLSFARLWRAVILGNWRSLGQIGWAIMVWANFFTITGLLINEGKIASLTPWLYVAGMILLLTFYVDWRNLGNIFNFPFTVIGSFTDVLSYIRLYAVGLSSYYVAMNVNGIADMCIGSHKIPLIILGISLVFLGHTMNIILSFLAVLVHGIRLNTLEFSNHMELQWKGFQFRPFKIEEIPLKDQMAEQKT